MTDRERNCRNLNPHKPARLAMALWGNEYSKQLGGSMDFWDKLTPELQRRCRELVAEIMASRDEDARERRA